MTTGVFAGPNLVNYNCSGVPCTFISLTSTTAPGTYNYTYTIYSDPSIGLYCTKSTTFNVQYVSGFSVSATSSGTVCSNLSGSNATVSAVATPSAGITFTWLPGNLYGATQTVSPSSTTIYTINASSSLCIFTAYLTVNTKSTCCTNTISAFNGTVLPSGTVSGPLAVNFDLVVPTGTVTYLQGELLFAPNVKITVQQGGYLIVDLAHLYACSSTMWQGIVLEDGARASSARTNLIEDAIVAFDVSNHTTSSITLPSYILEVANTTFNKNYIGIKIDNYQRSSTAAYPFSIKSSVFTSRTFTFNSTTWPYSTTTDLRNVGASTPTTGFASPYNLENATLANLKSPYSAQTASVGIEIDNSGWSSGGNYSGVKVGDETTEGSFNLFDNLLWSVNANNSVVYCFNNAFQNTAHYTPVHHAPYGGTAISSQISNNFNAYLNLSTPGTYSTNYSLGNRFWNCYAAVGMTNVYKFDCSYATIRSTQSTTNVSTPLGGLIGGIGIQATTNRFEFNINHCNFNNINTAISVPITSDTYTFASNTYTGVLAGNFNISNNFFGPQTNTSTSIGTNYINYAVNIQAPNTASWNVIAGVPLSISSNTVNRAYRGIYLNGYPTTSTIETNTILLVDDNVFITNQSAIRVENSTFNSVKTNVITGANTTNTIVALIYSGSNSGQVVTCNTLVTGYAGFQFDGSHGGTNVWKGNKMTSHVRGMGLTTNGIIGTQGSSGNPTDNIWSGTWTGGNNGTYVDGSSDAQFSKLWVKTTGMPPNPGYVFGLQSYSVTANTPTTTGAYSCGGGCGCCACRAIINLPQSGVQSNSSSNRLVNQINDAQYIAMTNNYRFLMTNDSVRNSDSVYIQFCNNLSGTSIDKFMQAENNFYSGNISQAQSISSAVTPTNDVEVNYKYYYDLYKEFANGSFDNTDSTNLFTFASKCPGKDGSCVYQARALYNSIYKNSFTFMDNCPKDDYERKKYLFDGTNEFNSWNVEIYPNPASKQITIITQEKSESLRVVIKDITGKIVLSENLVSSGFYGNLGLNLINGIYLISVQNSNNETVIKKLVINN